MISLDFLFSYIASQGLEGDFFILTAMEFSELSPARMATGQFGSKWNLFGICF